MEFQHPVVAFTAANNLEAHMIVEMLEAAGIPAQAVEDQSGVSLWALGTISQFHKPKVWVEETTAAAARELIRGFEDKRRNRSSGSESAADILVECESCRKTTAFPGSMNGTTQDCPHCFAYVDVGELPWEEDFGVPDEDS